MRQKGFGKKVLSLALAAAMSVSLCAPAWAEGVTGSSAGSGTTNSQQEQVDGEEGSAFDDEKQQNTDSVVEEDNAGNNVSEGEGEQNANSATDSDEEKENTADSDSTGAGAESSSDAEEQQNNYSAENELLSNEVLGIAAVNETDGESVVYVASVGEQGYTTLQDAIDKAAVNATVTLEANVALDNMLVISKAVTLDLMGKTISASDAFQKDNSASYNNHLVDIQADGVTIKNGVLEAGSNNNHTLNVWKASNVTLQNLTLDNTNTYGGAPLIVGSSNVTLAGNMNFITGENSWYSVNVDGTYNGMTLTFKENAKVALGTSPLGIQVDSSTAEKMVTLDFKSGVTVTGSSYPLVLNTQATNHPSEVMKVTGLANSNLKEPQIVGAVAKIDDVYYATLADAISNAAENATVVLLKDVAESVTIPSGKKVTLDLNNKILEMTNTGSVEIKDGADLKIQKGTIIAKQLPDGSTSLFNIQAGSSISLNKVGLDTNGSALYPKGNAAKVDVIDSTIAAGVYAVGTNASTEDNGGVVITLKDSFFNCTQYGYQNWDKDACAVMINVKGMLNIDNCAIVGSRQGVLVRGGTANVRNSTITTTGEYTTGIGQYLDGNWSSGDEVPMAALVVGNRSNAYNYPSVCTVENTVIVSENQQVPAIYTYGMDEADRKVTLTISGENTKVQGSISNNGKAATTISAGYYTEKVPQDLIPEDLACNLLDALYEGVYAYQVGEPVEVSDVQLEVEKPAVDAGEIGEEQIPDITGVSDKEKLANDLKDAASATQITQDTAQLVSNAALVEANVDGYKVTSNEVKEKAVEALKAAVENDDVLDEDNKVTITVTPVLAVNPLSPVVADDGTVAVPFDIELLYQVTASAETTTGKKVEVVLGKGNVANPPVMDITVPAVPVAALGYGENVTADEVATNLYVQHEHEGSVYYYRPAVTVLDKKVTVTFTNPNGFSVFTMKQDSRTTQVEYPTGTSVVYDPTDIGASLMSVSQSNFAGWTFEGVSGGPYKVLTEELLTKLSDLYSQNNTAIKAAAVFTEDTDDSSNSSAPAATPAPTAAPQQSGSNITYYTCQACGYHDWTATAEGYKCNHCGYIESVKQLSGYGNVKGVYEPKTSTAAAQTGAAASGTVSSAIPQTGDEQPITALVVVAVAALLGLGVTVVMKKRNND